LLGFFGLLATGYVNELFTKRAEDRKAKRDLLEEFGDILIEAEKVVGAPPRLRCWGWRRRRR